MSIKRNALGRGLDSLISMGEVQTSGSSAINEIPISQISPNPEQPRTNFDGDSLEELAMSIRELGIIQPLTLRSVGVDSYQIISGERRYRAARLAGLDSVPAYVRTANDSEITEMALIENIQREDLNAIEIALAYQNLLEQYGLTQDALSEKVGKKRTTIANYLRLLKLPAQVQMAIQKREMDQGHARALLGLEQPSMQVKLFNEIQQKGYSVRKVEEMVKAINSGETVVSGGKRFKDRKKTLPEEFIPLRDRLSDFFKTKVQMTCSSEGKGNISIAFASEEELERIVALFDKLR